MQGLLIALLIALLLLGGCGQPAEILGPFSGKTHRFVVDVFRLPRVPKDFAGDLDGNSRPKNQLGNIMGALALYVSHEMDASQGAAAQVAAGTVESVVEITIDDERLENDPTVGVKWVDGRTPEATPMGASFDRGWSTSNRWPLYQHPVSASVLLPIDGAADPVRLDLIGTDIVLMRDGRGGFDGELHGAIQMTDPLPLQKEGYRVVLQILAAWPDAHPDTLKSFDTDGDGTITFQEFLEQPIIINVFTPDVALFDAAGLWAPGPDAGARDSLSVGFGFHIKPCSSGSCLAPAAPSCLDRQRNGDETDRDCGGATCHPCAATLACKIDPDCQSNRCINGRCEK